jgi:hypothetical protein
VKLRIRSDQSGSALVMVMIFFLIFTVIGTAYLSLSALEASSSVAQVQRARSFIFAESALSQSLWRLNHGSDLLGTFDQDSLTAIYDSTTYLLTAEGKVGNTTCQLQILLQNDHHFNHVLSYTDDLDTNKYKINHLPGHEIKQFTSLPDIVQVLNYYYSIADYKYTGDQTFQGTMSSGIHFVEGEANLKNNTVLHGTIIATEMVKLLGSVTIIAQKVPPDSTSYYPAIIAGDTAKTEIDIHTNPQVTIFGAVFATGKIFIMGMATGPLIAPEIKLRGPNEINDHNDPFLYSIPPGFNLIESESLQKIIVRGSWQETGYL